MKQVSGSHEGALVKAGPSRRQLLKFGSLAPLALAGSPLMAPVTALAQSSEIVSQRFAADPAPLGKLDQGIGFNWVDKFPVYPALDDKAGWRQVLAALDELRPGFIRFWLDTETCVGKRPGEINGEINKDAATLQRAEIVAGWAARHGCTLMFDTAYVPMRYRFEPGVAERKEMEKNPFIEMAARDNAAYVKSFVVPLLQHLLLERKLTGALYFNAYNEPLQYGPFRTPGDAPDPYVYYVAMYREIHQQLSEAGLYPQKIKLAGVEAIQPERFPALEFLSRGVDIDPYIDMYTIHYYFHRFDWMAPVSSLPNTLEESMDRGTPPLVKYCKRRGKFLMGAEVGWYPNDSDPYPMPSDPLAQARPHATLTTAETILRGINAGLSGFGIWSLFNTGDFDGAWQVLSYKNGKIETAEHPYSTYRLLTRYARPGSEVFPLKAEKREWPWQYVFGTALRTPQDKVVLYLINDSLVESRRVQLELPAAWAGRKLHRITKDNVRIGVETATLELKQAAGRAVLDDLLVASSLTAYVEET